MEAIRILCILCFVHVSIPENDQPGAGTWPLSVNKLWDMPRRVPENATSLLKAQGAGSDQSWDCHRFGLWRLP